MKKNQLSWSKTIPFRYLPNCFFYCLFVYLYVRIKEILQSFATPAAKNIQQKVYSKHLTNKYLQIRGLHPEAFTLIHVLSLFSSSFYSDLLKCIFPATINPFNSLILLSKPKFLKNSYLVSLSAVTQHGLCISFGHVFFLFFLVGGGGRCPLFEKRATTAKKKKAAYEVNLSKWAILLLCIRKFQMISYCITQLSWSKKERG